jgi:cellobiose-specific phosphotransferase system component IIC
MSGHTIAAVIIGLITGYIIARAMRPPVLVISAPEAAPSAPPPAAPALTAAPRTVVPSAIDSLAS